MASGAFDMTDLPQNTATDREIKCSIGNIGTGYYREGYVYKNDTEVDSVLYCGRLAYRLRVWVDQIDNNKMLLQVENVLLCYLPSHLKTMQTQCKHCIVMLEDLRSFW